MFNGYLKLKKKLTYGMQHVKIIDFFAKLGITPIEQKCSTGCPLSFVRRPLRSNKKRVYISNTGELSEDAL